MTDLRDKVAIVTGGASGLGRATCVALAEAGARVVVADMNAEDGERVAAELDGAFVRTDVSDLEQNQAMVGAAIERFGGVDLAYLNAGVTTGFGIGDSFDLERYRRVMGVNLDGVVFGMQAVLPSMRARGGGAIVATASLAGLTSVPLDPLYAANKHAVVGLVRSIGPALAPDGIRVNAVCPGYSESAMTVSFRDALEAQGLPLIPAATVAEAVLALFTGEQAGECWFVQAGRPAAAFEFRRLPGPRPMG